jgi:hypothetical protein
MRKTTKGEKPSADLCSAAMSRTALQDRLSRSEVIHHFSNRLAKRLSHPPCRAAMNRRLYMIRNLMKINDVKK